jgi:hypothetical protein
MHRVCVDESEATPEAAVERQSDASCVQGELRPVAACNDRPLSERGGRPDDEDRGMRTACNRGRDAAEHRRGYGPSSARADNDQLRVELARNLDAALIVVGSRGRGAVRAALLGSFSTSVLANASCPVVVVPPVVPGSALG